MTYPNLIDWLRKAIASNAHGERAHTVFGPMVIYVRVGRRAIEGQMQKCIQLASMDTPEAERGQGTFDRLIEAIRSITDLPIYVEAVLNPSLAKGLERRGWTKIEDNMDGLQTSWILK